MKTNSILAVAAMAIVGAHADSDFSSIGIYCNNPGQSPPQAGNGNQGVAIAIYNTTCDQYSFDISPVQNGSPIWTGALASAYSGGNCLQLAVDTGLHTLPYDGSPTVNTEYVSVMYTTYMYARRTSTYKFEIGGFSDTPVDDLVMLWVGKEAESGWTKDNSKLNLAYPSAGQTASVDLTIGTYTPVRLLWDNKGGKGAFHLKITEVATGRTLDATSGDLVTGICAAADSTTGTGTSTADNSAPTTTSTGTDDNSGYVSGDDDSSDGSDSSNTSSSPAPTSSHKGKNSGRLIGHCDCSCECK